MTPRSRGFISRNASIVPYTAPRYVTSVTRRNSSGVMDASGENTVVIASFTQTSIGPSSSSMRRAASRTWSGSATSVGIATDRTSSSSSCF